MPATARAAISAFMDGAAPHITVPDPYEKREDVMRRSSSGFRITEKRQGEKHGTLSSEDISEAAWWSRSMTGEEDQATPERLRTDHTKA